jgi:hypothetical protein
LIHKPHQLLRKYFPKRVSYQASPTYSLGEFPGVITVGQPALNSWKSLSSPQLEPVTENLLAFNKWITQPLGILPQLPIILGGKIVYIDVMVVHDPLDFNFLLG